jgi:hypothetical protein
MKKFSIILFTKNNSFSVVPSNWLSKDKNFCYWPSKRTKNSSHLQKDPESKPDHTWSIFPILFKKSYGKQIL